MKLTGRTSRVSTLEKTSLGRLRIGTRLTSCRRVLWRSKQAPHTGASITQHSTHAYALGSTFLTSAAAVDSGPLFHSRQRVSQPAPPSPVAHAMASAMLQRRTAAAACLAAILMRFRHAACIEAQEYFSDKHQAMITVAVMDCSLECSHVHNACLPACQRVTSQKAPFKTGTMHGVHFRPLCALLSSVARISSNMPKVFCCNPLHSCPVGLRCPARTQRHNANNDRGAGSGPH